MSVSITAGTATVVNQTSPNPNTGGSAITWLENGGYVITWQIFNTTTNLLEIWSRRFSADGTALGTESRVNTVNYSYQSSSQIAALEDGGYVVVWNRAVGASGVWMQRFDASGNMVGTETQVNTYSQLYQELPSITSLADGGWFVAWQSQGQDGNSYGSYGQRYAANGSKVGGEIHLTERTGGNQDTPRVATLTDGTLVVVFSDYNGGLPLYDVYMQRWNNAGDKLGDSVLVNVQVNNRQQYYGDVTALADGGYLVTWNADGQDGSDYGVFMRRYAADGTALTGEVQINTTTANKQMYARTALLGDGGWVIVWESTYRGEGGPMSPTYADAWAQVYDADGNKVGGEIRVTASSINSYSGTRPDVTATNDGFIVSWSGAADSSTESKSIYQKRYVLTSDLTGTTGADTLDGRGIKSSLAGLAGDDTYFVDGNDTVSENADAGMDQVVSTASYTLGANIEMLVLDGTGNINGTGNNQGNIIFGNSGNNRIDGGVDIDGSDVMTGGLGDDTYIADNTGDAVLESQGEGNDLVETSANMYMLLGNIERLTYTGSGNFFGFGDDTANIMTGGSGNDLLSGQAGSDTLYGGAGADNLDGDSGNDSVVGGAGNDSLAGGFDSDADTLAGGEGDDTYLIVASDDAIVENDGEGADLVVVDGSVASYTLSGHVETLTYIGNSDFAGTGSAQANSLTSGDGADTLSGAAGNDTLDAGNGNDSLDGGTGDDSMAGGGGDDTYVVDSDDDVVFEGEDSGNDEVYTSASYTLGADVERLTLTGGGHINATGNSANNIISGNSGNNRLDGGEGDDFMSGGLGDDTYIVDGMSEGVDENNGGGHDRVETSTAFFMLADGVEDLVYTGFDGFTGFGGMDDNAITGGDLADILAGMDGADTLTGGDGDDYVDGSAGIDSLIGGGGNDSLDAGNDLVADTLKGGAGNDTYLVYLSNDVILEDEGEGIDFAAVDATADSYTLADNVENLYRGASSAFAGTGNGLDNDMTSGDGNDTLLGLAGADTLTGGQGNDSLDGGTGNDSLTGGAGDDTYVVDSLSDVVSESEDNGSDTVMTSITLTLGEHLENLTLTGAAHINSTGNGAQNTLFGNSGNNRIDGDDNADTMYGGVGDDTFIVEAGNDEVREGQGEGNDLIETTFDVFVLPENVERLTYFGSTDFLGSGSETDNIITGDAGNDTLWGLRGSDTLYGGAGNDLLDGDNASDSLNGGAGDDNLTPGYDLVADTMAGGEGNDTYQIFGSNDAIVENSGEGDDLAQVDGGVTVYTLSDHVETLIYYGNSAFTGTGSAQANSLTSGAGHDTLSGAAGNDTLIAGNGNDSLDGGAGDDSMDGGAGNDTYVVDASDTVTENASQGTDLVRTSLASYTLGSNLENLTYTGAGNFTGTGNGGDNVLTGGAGNDSLDGGSGTDSLAGGAGNDTYVVDSASDAVTESSEDGTDTVRTALSALTLAANVENLVYTGAGTFTGTGNTGNNAITGGSGNDTLTGGDGNDSLDGGTGNDSLIGGLGNDTFVVDASDSVSESASQGTDEIRTSLTFYYMGSNVENLTYTGSGNFVGIGNALDNIVTGNAGNDALNGGVGADTLVGGTGNDTYNLDNAADSVTEASGEGTDDVRTNLAAYTLGVNLEYLAYFGTGSFSGTGNSLANSITGAAGNDVLDGGAGNDTLTGVAGNDTYIVDASDTVTENASEGTDEVRTGLATYTLGTNLENLAYTGSSAFTGTGNSLANSITGGAGNDTLTGGDGNDTYVVGSGDQIVENASEGTDLVQTAETSYSLGSELENLTYTGSGNFTGTGNGGNNSITGGDGNDTLSGLSGNDTLTGGQGNDSLDGGTGNDGLTGGTGNDTYVVDSASDTVSENADEGTDTVVTTLASYTLSSPLENLIHTGSTAFTGIGNALANAITGGAGNDSLDGVSGNDNLTGGDGNDTLDGGVSGNDTLEGGAGNDSYIATTGDTVTETADNGTDTVQTLATAWSLSANVENLTYSGGSNFTGTGNTLANTITGSSGNDTLSGGDGNDSMTGATGTDSLSGGNGDDTLFGGNLVDTLSGGDGHDSLSGGAGNDTLTGNAGNDTYVVDAADSVTEADSEGTDLVQTTLTSYTLGNHIENLTYTGSSNFTGIGNSLNNAITSGAGNDSLDGGSGTDTLTGGAGNDTYVVDAADNVTEASGEGTDTVRTALSSYTLGDHVEHLIYTGSSAFTGTGNALNNSLTGGAGNDVLTGGDGTDTLVGGAGNDTYYASYNDTLTEAADGGTDTLYVEGGNVNVAANIEIIIATGSGNMDVGGNAANNTITGNDGNNVLYGDGGDDRLDGGAGSNTLQGGAGNDTYVVRTETDYVLELSYGDGDGDTVESSRTYTLGAAVEHLVLTGVSHIDGTGNELNNAIAGNSGNNRLDGQTGADTLSGGDGNDTYVVSTGDSVVESDGKGTDTVRSDAAWTLGANLENLVLTGTATIDGNGNSLNNSLTGNAANNQLNGHEGADTLIGGDGADAYIIDNAGDVITETSGMGYDTAFVYGYTGTYTLSDNVEALHAGTTGSFTGNSGDNYFQAATDQAVTLSGGAGNDTYAIGAETSFTLVETSGEGTDVVWTTRTSYSLAAHIENLLYTGISSNFTGTGNAGANAITSENGYDWLDGGAGNDSLTGGGNDDTYVVDGADLVTETENHGTDTVRSSVTYTLTAHVENLILTGSDSIDGTGNSLNNVITGNAGANRLDGGAGSNTLSGGAGNDTYIVNGYNDLVDETGGGGTDTVISSVMMYNLGTGVENLVMASGSSPLGGFGNELANVITGNDGMNILNGMAGADTLSGGLGDDNYMIDNAGDTIIEGSDVGRDTVMLLPGLSTYTLAANVETMVFGFTVGSFYGNAGNNLFSSMGVAAVTMTGGAGDDSYTVVNAGDSVVEDADGGRDMVSTTFAAYTLAAHVEALTYFGASGFAGTGNALDNAITGGTLGDSLDGAAGNDTLTGAAGNDSYVIDSASDSVVEELDAGTDQITVTGTVSSYTLAANVETLKVNTSVAGTYTGNALANTLQVIGSAEATLAGGAGNDIYIVDTAGITITENPSEGLDTIQTSLASYTMALRVEILTLTNLETAFTATGNATGNAITGGNRNDSLDGGASNDTLIGGRGDDTYVVDAADLLSENTDAGTDLVRSAVTWTLAENFENLELTGSSAINGTGNSVANLLTGNSGANSLTGGAGDDTYVIGTGDTVTEASGEGTDTVRTDLTAYTLGNNVENLAYTGSSAFTGAGNSLANAISSGAGNDSLDGGTGNDSLAGGAGNDTYMVDGSDAITEGSDAGTDLVRASVSHTLAAHVDNLELTGSSAINGTGNALANSITGNSGANSLAGGAGDDTYVIDTGDTVTEAASEGTDTVRTTLTSYTLGENLENLVYTGGSAFTGTGNGLANALTSGSGADSLDGGAGNDSLTGGSGNDTYAVDATGDTVTENSGEGSDIVYASATFTLSANIENLTLTGTGDINGTGNASANTLSGTTGANLLDGGAGNDSLTGGLGNDTYGVDSASDAITENAGEGTDTVAVTTLASYTLATNFENLTFTGSTAFTGTGTTGDNSLSGGSGDDSLNGGSGADTLSGGAGNDYLDGGASRDTMTGGAGNDTYIVNSLSDTATEDADAGTDEVRITGSVSTFTVGANIERIYIAATFAGNFAGNASANRIETTGTAQATLAGGAGDDTYIIAGSTDVILESSGQGTDIVQTALASWTLASNVEQLTYTGSGNFSGTGNSSANAIIGGAGNDSLNGGTGADSLTGGAGDDSYTVDNAGDVLTELSGGGSDSVASSVTFALADYFENLTLSGTGAINATGNAAANRLTGNSGANVLTGGSGDDTYTVDSSDSVVEADNGGSDTVNAATTFTLGSYVEHLVLTGTSAADGTGNSLANTITGNTAANRLDGGAGNDTLTGGTGDDTYVIDSASDSLVEAADGGSDTVISAVSLTLADNFEHLTLSGSATTATGNSVANRLTGNSGANLLTGNGGADTLAGGAGNDTYVIDSADTVTEDADAGTDTVQSGDSHTLGANVENLVLTGNSAVNGTGNALANAITGNAAANEMTGGDGADTLTGGTGDDTYVADSNDSVIEADGGGTDTIRSATTYTLGAYVEHLVLTGSNAADATGNSLNNSLTGNSGNNLLTGNGGADTLAGGAGNDTYVADDSDTVTEDADAGTDTLQSDTTRTLGANLENLVLTGTTAVNGTGNELANAITGNAAANELTGGDGADTLTGGAGDDIYNLDSADSVAEADGSGSDTVRIATSYTLGEYVENLVLTGTNAVNGTGNTLANSLTGNTAANRLDGGTGADSLAGGLGNDTYVVDDAGDTVTETSTGGTDAVEAWVNYQLGSYQETLVLQGSADLTATGNTGGNSLTGNTGNNSLDGGAGADTLTGGLGNDTYVVDDVLDQVIELSGGGTDLIKAGVSWTLLAEQEHLTLTGTETINGTGNASDNTLTGNTGNNSLDGGAGADYLTGGKGDDSYYVDNALDVIYEATGNGTDTVISSLSWTLGSYQENLTLTGADSLSGTGNTMDNVLTGNSGNNALSGGTGNDTTAGGLGDDTYTVDATTDRVTELDGQGNDLVKTTATFTLSDFIESLTLTGSTNIDGTGNSGNNTLTGNTGNNALNGGAGADYLTGGKGDDTYYVDSAGDTVYEGTGNGTDLVYSTITYKLTNCVENLTLTGSAAINATGNTMNNRITGNTGNNSLAGGTGLDIFIASGGADTITDFSVSEGDRISLGVTNGAATISQSGANVLIDFGGGHTITVLNTTNNATFLAQLDWVA